MKWVLEILIWLIKKGFPIKVHFDFKADLWLHLLNSTLLSIYCPLIYPGRDSVGYLSRGRVPSWDCSRQWTWEARVFRDTTTNGILYESGSKSASLQGGTERDRAFMKYFFKKSPVRWHKCVCAYGFFSLSLPEVLLCVVVTADRLVVLQLFKHHRTTISRGPLLGLRRPQRALPGLATGEETHQPASTLLPHRHHLL